MLILIIICFILSLCYAALMLLYRKGWAMQSVFAAPGGFVPRTRISIIIAARNEAANIGSCIHSILAQHYPVQLFEVVVVDDHSSDGTQDIVNGFANGHIKCISLKDYIQDGEKVIAYKKKAIATGISICKGDLIITTDADCIVPPCWLEQIAARYESSNAVMIAGPVAFTCNNSIVERFQVIDFMSMQGITAAANELHLGNMSNGANLAFTKDAYLQVGGYDGIDHLASGDDYLLMTKLQKAFPGRAVYLKSPQAIVDTAPQPGWAAFIRQRIRWASKSGKYDDKRMTFILSLVYLFNLSFLVLLITGVWLPVLFKVAGFMFLLKIIVELYYLLPVAAFYKQNRQLWYFPFLQPLHIAYIIIAGLLGFAGVYEWKGRSVR